MAWCLLSAMPVPETNLTLCRLNLMKTLDFDENKRNFDILVKQFVQEISKIVYMYVNMKIVIGFCFILQFYTGSLYKLCTGQWY